MKSRKTENRKNLLRGRREKFVLDAKTGKIIRQLALFGHTVPEIAKIIGTSEATLRRRLKEQDAETEITGDESVLTGLLRAREIADAAVVEALYNRAIGCRIGKSFYPPDVQAQIHWLRNRCPDQWRDIQKTEIMAQIKKPPSLSIVIEKDVSGGKK